MNVLTIPYKKKVYTYTFASSWAEVPAKHLPWLGKNIWPIIDAYKSFVDQVKKGNHNEAAKLDATLQDFRITLLIKFCGITKWPFKKRNKAFYSLEPDEVADLLECLGFLFKKLEVKRPFDSFERKMTAYFGPDENLGNISAEEFHFAERAFIKATEGDRDAAAQLAAILYRPMGKGSQYNPTNEHYKGDLRQKFNRFALDAFTRRYAKVPDTVVYPILLWYGSCRLKIMSAHPAIFNGKGGKPSNDGWLEVFRALSKSTLEFDEIASKPLSFLLWEMGKLHNEAQERERQKI